MLYLHCGFPRTSTSTLQAALFAHRERLADAGLLYPEKWIVQIDLSHNGLNELLKSAHAGEGGFDELKGFLAAAEGSDVLLSAELIASWLLTPGRQSTLLDFVAAAREVTAVRCIWTLRRCDEAAGSLYLHKLRYGFEVPPPAEHFDGIRRLDVLFSGIQRVAEAVGDDVVYVKYDRGGAHNGELLRAFGIPDDVAAPIRKQIAHGPRRNAGASQKCAAVLLNREALSARSGIELSGGALRRAFYREGFEFERDRPCELVDDPVRRALHERALAGARSQGFAPYLEFFDGVEIDPVTPLPLGPEVLTDADLARLLEHLGIAAPA